MSFTLEFEAEEYAVDAIVRQNDVAVLRFWIESTGRIEIATICCGAHASRTLQDGPLRCIKCKATVGDLPSTRHAYNNSHETVIHDWLQQLNVDVVEAGLLAIHITMSIEALMEELLPLYENNEVETIQAEEDLWARIASIAHREKVLL